MGMYYEVHITEKGKQIAKQAAMPGKKMFSEESRRSISDAQKDRWAAIRSAAPKRQVNHLPLPENTEMVTVELI